jgi:hypothetical protein
MSATLYDGTIAVNKAILNTLSHILHKAEERPDASALLQARLVDDMFPLDHQIRIATQYSEFTVARLTGREPVMFEGNPKTFAECYERIETVLKSLNEADKDLVNQRGDVIESTQLGPKGKAEMSCAAYAHTVTLPNIYFHVTTAYGILRKEGVALGKMDFYTGYFPLYPAITSQ